MPDRTDCLLLVSAMNESNSAGQYLATSEILVKGAIPLTALVERRGGLYNPTAPRTTALRAAQADLYRARR
jgi:hypothetical protein